jgi:hypothetical protein
MPLSKQDRQTFWINEYFNTAGDARLSPDEASAFEREHHLVDGRWADSEVALQSVSAGGRRCKRVYA